MVTRGSVQPSASSLDRLISVDVSRALEDGRPVVALESTVISHGLPWPRNLETARDMEAAVRESGAVPATIAVIQGVIRIGISDANLITLASGDGSNTAGVMKANRRDVAAAVAHGLTAATTVSATLWISRRNQIEPRVMATGGLGGVHRGASVTGDISTDLDELARADGCVVVCSGFKSILDVPSTLEALETRGVLIVGYQTDELPGFLTRSSRLRLEQSVDSVAAAAALIRAHRSLGTPGAIVLAQPVPEGASVDSVILEEATDQALARARECGIAGKAVTPFLLAAVRERIGNVGLTANEALLIENARLAGQVAWELGR